MRRARGCSFCGTPFGTGRVRYVVTGQGPLLPSLAGCAIGCDECRRCADPGGGGFAMAVGCAGAAFSDSGLVVYRIDTLGQAWLEPPTDTMSRSGVEK